MTFHSQAFEFGDEKAGGGRALSCVLPLISTWPRAGRRREMSVNVTTVTPAYKSWGSRRENWFLLLQSSPLSPRSLTKGPHHSLSLSLSHTHTHIHAHTMCVLGPTSHFSNLGLSDSCLFVLLTFSLAFVAMDVSPTLRARALSLNLTPSIHAPLLASFWY